LLILQHDFSSSNAFTYLFPQHHHSFHAYLREELDETFPRQHHSLHTYLLAELDEKEPAQERPFPTETNRKKTIFSDVDHNHSYLQHNKDVTSSDISQEYAFWEDSLSISSFNMDLENLAQEDPQKAADALDIMETLYRTEPDNPYYVKPTVSSYTIIMDGWVQCQALPPSSFRSDTVQQPYHRENNHHHYGAQQAQKWLDRLEDAYNKTGDPDLKPNMVSYLHVCQKWADDYAQDFDGESISKAEAILRKIRQQERDRQQKENYTSTATSSSISSNNSVKLWSIVLDGWCRRAGKVTGAIKRAEKLLTDMEEEATKQEEILSRNLDSTKSKNLGDVIRPNIVTYTSFIGGLARSREQDSCMKAEDVLKRMEKFGVDPDMVAYSAVLGCYAKASSRKERALACKRALEILGTLETEYVSGDKYFLKPNLITYSTAIKAIGNSLDRESASLAEKVLRRMYSLHEAGTIGNIKPQTSTYNAVISAYAAHSRRTMGGQPRFSSPSKAKQKIGLMNARRAEQLLVEMTKRARAGETDVQPNVRTWGAVLSAWAESGQADAGSEAQRVLDSMLELYARGDSDVRPNFVCYTTAVAAKGNSALPSQTPEAIAKNSAVADQIEEKLIAMENDYEESLDIDRRPNTITYITAMDCFNKLDEENGAARSQRTVDRIIRLYAKGLGHVRPSRIVFNTLINAWSRSPSKEKGARAEEVFQWMEKRYREAGDYIVKPDEVSLCGVLNAHANNADPLRAQQILDKVESMTTKERGFQHTTICHNIVIKAWGRSREPNAVKQAEKILTRLEDLWAETGKEYLKPDVTTYSSVINCCAYDSEVSQREESFQVAIRTFDKMCASSSARPNGITYGTLFKAIANLTPMDEERENIIRPYFAQCCKEGQVDAFVLSQVRNTSPLSLYRELVLQPCGLDNRESVDVVLKNLPREWKRSS